MSQINYHQLAPEAVSKLGAVTSIWNQAHWIRVLLVEIMAASIALTYTASRRGGWRDAATT
jgi:hypothetical protein